MCVAVPFCHLVVATFSRPVVFSERIARSFIQFRMICLLSSCNFICTRALVFRSTNIRHKCGDSHCWWFCASFYFSHFLLVPFHHLCPFRRFSYFPSPLVKGFKTGLVVFLLLPTIFIVINRKKSHSISLSCHTNPQIVSVKSGCTAMIQYSAK